MTLTCQSSHVMSLVDVGYDLVEWLMERLQIEESTELLHLASLLCQSGYFFPVADSKSLVVKDDGGLYRFQVRCCGSLDSWKGISMQRSVHPSF